jgi:predicted flap endonuclease-1-like 5' DNA nuclease
MGINKNYQSAKGTCKVTFSYPTVDGIKSVQVMGDFNNWDSSIAPKMKKSKDEFNTVIELKAGASYEFRYLLDSERWDNDFSADKYVASPYLGINNSVLILEAVEAPAKKATSTKAVTKEATPAKAPKVAKEKVATAPKAKKVVEKVAAAAKAVKKVVEPKKAVVKSTSAPKATSSKVSAPKPTAPKTAAPKVAATKSSNDDLTKIEGIGPKIASLLVEKGIKSFGDLSKAKEANLKAILSDAGSKFQMHDPSTWAQQATLAAKGNWDELKTLQDKLNGGKK